MLTVENLTVEFESAEGTVRAVSDVSFTLRDGEVLGVVGESGSGKSVTMQAIMGLLQSPPAKIRAERIDLDGKSLVGLTPKQWRTIRGRAIGMVFQEPFAALDPLIRTGTQIAEAIRAHHPELDPRQVDARIEELVTAVRIPDPRRRMREYPHQFSGGMAQRAAIAMAIANEPRVLIADEPTTALDVTVQAQVMRTLTEVRQRTKSAMVVITHDLGLVADIADQIVIMYAGRVVESGPVDAVLNAPQHPYTHGLLKSMPSLAARANRLHAIPGHPPNLARLGAGCAFMPRCEVAAGRPECSGVRPLLTSTSQERQVACHFPYQVASGARRD